MKKIISALFAIVLILGLVAGCGTGEESAPTDEESTQGQEENEGVNEQETKEEDATKEETNGSGEGESGATDEALPEEKELKVYGEMVEDRPAKLEQSDLGYSIYILDNYTFSAEEPNKDVILSDVDGEFFLRIEPLPADTDAADLKANALTALKGIYKEDAIEDRDPAELIDDAFHDATFYVTGSDASGSVSYMVKDIDGQPFRFTFHIPNKEAAEGVEPGLWAMARSIVVK